MSSDSRGRRRDHLPVPLSVEEVAQSGQRALNRKIEVFRGAPFPLSSVPWMLQAAHAPA